MADPAARINELNAARARWMADPANMQYTNPQAYQQQQLTQQRDAANAALQRDFALQPGQIGMMGGGASNGGGGGDPSQGSALDNFYRVNGVTGGTHTTGNWFGSAAQQQQPAINRASDGGISPGGMPVGARPQDGQMYASTGAPVGMSAVRPQAGPGIAQQIRPGMTLQGAGQMPPGFALQPGQVGMMGGGATNGGGGGDPSQGILTNPATRAALGFGSGTVTNPGWVSGAAAQQAQQRPAYAPSNGSADRDPGPQPMPQGYGREGDRPAPPMVYARATPPIMAPMPVQRPNMNPSMPAPAPAMRNQNTPMGGRDFMAAPAQQPNNPRDKIAMALMNQRNGGN